MDASASQVMALLQQSLNGGFIAPAPLPPPNVRSPFYTAVPDSSTIYDQFRTVGAPLIGHAVLGMQSPVVLPRVSSQGIVASIYASRVNDVLWKQAQGAAQQSIGRGAANNLRSVRELRGRSDLLMHLDYTNEVRATT